MYLFFFTNGALYFIAFHELPKPEMYVNIFICCIYKNSSLSAISKEI